MSSKQPVKDDDDYPLFRELHVDYLAKSVSERVREHFDWSSGKRYQWGVWGVLQKIACHDTTHHYLTEDFALVYLPYTTAEVTVWIGEERKLVSWQNDFKINKIYRKCWE